MVLAGSSRLNGVHRMHLYSSARVKAVCKVASFRTRVEALLLQLSNDIVMRQLIMPAFMPSLQFFSECVLRTGKRTFLMAERGYALNMSVITITNIASQRKS